MEKKASTSWTPLNFPESTGKRYVFRVYLKDPWMKRGEQRKNQDNCAQRRGEGSGATRRCGVYLQVVLSDGRPAWGWS